MVVEHERQTIACTGRLAPPVRRTSVGRRKHERGVVLTREQIELEAARRTEANIYSLNNRYLSEAEKLETEIWYQSPGDVMLYAFAILSVLSIRYPIHWPVLIGVPVLINLLMGTINWFFYSRRVLWLLYLTILHNLVQWLLLLAAAGFLLYTGHFWLAGAILLWKIGILIIFELHMILFTFLTKSYGMHPKYAFHKRQYGRRYPFEESILEP
jgi:hypothetical protein